MRKMKKLSVLFLVVVLFSACGEYQKVLNKGTTEDQYKMATKLYEEGKYNKSIQLFEKIIPKYQRKPQMERIQFMVAEATSASICPSSLWFAWSSCSIAYIVNDYHNAYITPLSTFVSLSRKSCPPRVHCPVPTSKRQPCNGHSTSPLLIAAYDRFVS